MIDIRDQNQKEHGKLGLTLILELDYIEGVSILHLIIDYIDDCFKDNPVLASTKLCP